MTKRLPKVLMAHGAVVGDRFICSGPYSALPFNPYQHPQWPPFRVNFNKHWIDVQVVEGDYDEDWGWKAISVEALNRDADATPKVELRRTTR